MSRPFPLFSKNRRRTLFELALLVALIPIAIFFWTAPARHENRLQTASLSELQSIVQRSPQDGRALYHLGLRQREAGDLPAALETFKQAADARPGDLEIWRAAAEATEALQGPGGAVQILRLFVEQNSKNAAGRVALAGLLERLGAYKQAGEAAQAALKLEPDNAEAWRIAGQVALRSLQTQEAAQAFRRAIALAPQEGTAHARLGDTLATEKKWPEAVAAYREALRLLPEDPVTQLSLARALLETSAEATTIQEARGLLEKSAAQRPDIPQTSLYLGRCYAAQGNWRAALPAFQRAARLDPSLSEAYFELTRAYRALGQTAQAAQTEAKQKQIHLLRDQYRTLQRRIDTAGASTPEGQRLRLELARKFAQGGSYLLAYNLYRHLAEQLPERQDIAREFAAIAPRALPIPDVLEMGERQLRAEQSETAIRSFMGVLYRDETNAGALEGVGLALAQSNQQPLAVKYLIEATHRDPSLIRAQLALAQANLDGGFPQEAIRRLEIATRAAPQNALAWNRLGQALRQSPTRLPDAEAALAKAVELEPKNRLYLLDLADVQAENLRLPAAEASYRAVLALPNPPPEAKARFGAFLAENFPEKQEEAERLLNEVLSADPDDDFARYHLGKRLLEKGETTAAIAALERVATRATEARLKEVWYTLSRAYRKAGENAKADRAANIAAQMQNRFVRFTTALERLSRNPGSPEARLEMARAGAAWGEHARALKEYEIYLKRRPEDAAVRREKQTLENSLKAQKKMPSMELFNALVASSTARSAPPDAAP